MMKNCIFPKDLTEGKWLQFNAQGYKKPVTGIIYREGNTAYNGLPIGTVDTGGFDLETNGTIGYMTMFNSLSPRRGPLNLPFLGLNIDGATHLLCANSLPGTKAAKEVHYWGHYPVADMEFVLDAPVSAGMRTWTPFIPGDVATSNTPGAVFEISIRNQSSEKKTAP